MLQHPAIKYQAAGVQCNTQSQVPCLSIYNLESVTKTPPKRQWKKNGGKKNET